MTRTLPHSKHAAGVIYGLLTVLLLLLLETAKSEPSPAGIIAHRGFSTRYPENTVLAVRKAIDAGAHGVEIDLKLSADLHPVVMHDATIDRTTDGFGPIEALTLAEIRQLDAGSWFGDEFAGIGVPTFKEMLAVTPDNIWLNVDLLPASDPAALASRAAQAIIESGLTDNVYLGTKTMEGRIAALSVAISNDTTLLLSNMENQGIKQEYIDATIEGNFSFIQFNNCTNAPNIFIPSETNKIALSSAQIRINYFSCDQLGGDFTSAHSENLLYLLTNGIHFAMVDDVERALRALEKYIEIPRNVLSPSLDPLHSSGEGSYVASWYARPRIVYTLQCSTNFGSAWFDISAGLRGRGADMQLVVTSPSSASAFYRVVMSPADE